MLIDTKAGGGIGQNFESGGSYIRDYEATSKSAGAGLSSSSDEGFLGIPTLNKGDWQAERNAPRTFDEVQTYNRAGGGLGATNG